MLRSLARYYVEEALECIKNEDSTQAKVFYEKSAQLFESEELFLEAAKSYNSIQEYEKSKEFFVKGKAWAEAGEIVLFLISNYSQKETSVTNQKVKTLYEEAVLYFEQANKYTKILECCKFLKDYFKTLETLIKYKDFLCDYIETLEYNMRIYFEELEKEITEIGKYLYFSR